MLTPIPCLFMRGGTSRGPFFLESDLPADPALRDRVLLAVMGSPDLRQIDGLGGADPLTSKVAIVARSERPGVDLEFLFAQVLIKEPRVDTTPNCGNMLAAVAPFAIERRLVAGPAMNLGDVSRQVVPKRTLVGPARAAGKLCTRAFIPHDCHAAVGVLGAVTVASAAVLDGSVARAVAVVPPGLVKLFSVE